MSDSVKKYHEMLEDGYVPKEHKPDLRKKLEEFLNELSSSKE